MAVGAKRKLGAELGRAEMAREAAGQNPRRGSLPLRKWGKVAGRLPGAEVVAALVDVADPGKIGGSRLVATHGGEKDGSSRRSRARVRGPGT